MSCRDRSVIGRLPEDLKDTVNEMILTGTEYDEIIGYLRENGVQVSKSMVSRYVQKYMDIVEKVRMAQENMKAIVAEMEKYPDLDVTDALVRLTTHNMLAALSEASEDDWKEISIDKMLRESSALIRAAAYKKRVEVQNQDTTEAGLDAVKSLVWEAMAKERPDLYRQVRDYLETKKE